MRVVEADTEYAMALIENDRKNPNGCHVCSLMVSFRPDSDSFDSNYFLST
jgi:hypothetical protein